MWRLHYPVFEANIGYTAENLDLIATILECRIFSNEINRLAPGLTEKEGPEGKTVYLPETYPFANRLYRKFENYKTKLKEKLKIKAGTY